MPTKGYSLDSNIVSAYLRGNNRRVLKKMRDVTRVGLDIKIDVICYYEIRRGLVESGNQQKLDEFEYLIRQLELLSLRSRKVLILACQIWANLKKKNQLRQPMMSR